MKTRTSRLPLALFALFALAGAAACGVDDHRDLGVDVDHRRADAVDAAGAVLAIAAVDVDVSACPCRCVTETNTTLTVHGRGFVEGARVTVDGVEENGFVVDGATLSVFLWASPAAGRHDVGVEVVDDDGVVHIDHATFTME